MAAMQDELRKSINEGLAQSQVEKTAESIAWERIPITLRP
jgi:hypothetical protein